MGQTDVPRLASDLRLAIGQLARRVRAETPVPLGQLGVLGLLDREGPRTTSELALQQAVRHQSVARTVGQLLEAGQVTASPHESDGRKTQLAITAAGRAVLAAERARRVDWLAAGIEEALAPAEQRLLREATDLLGRLAEIRAPAP